jgi:hypothetical protein
VTVREGQACACPAVAIPCIAFSPGPAGRMCYLPITTTSPWVHCGEGSRDEDWSAAGICDLAVGSRRMLALRRRAPRRGCRCTLTADVVWHFKAAPPAEGV